MHKVKYSNQWKFVCKKTFYQCPCGLIPCPYYVQGNCVSNTSAREWDSRGLEFGKSWLHFSDNPVGTILRIISSKCPSIWNVFSAIIQVIPRPEGCDSHGVTGLAILGILEFRCQAYSATPGMCLCLATQILRVFTSTLHVLFHIYSLLPLAMMLFSISIICRYSLWAIFRKTPHLCYGKEYVICFFTFLCLLTVDISLSPTLLLVLTTSYF